MLQVQEISKQYRTGDLVQRALDKVSLTFGESEFVAILGPSGSGKTTLLNVIGGLDRYDSGDLLINGISTKNYKDRNWDSYRNHSIGFVFQSYNLIPHQSVLANVELALTIGGIRRADRKKRARAALEAVGLAEQAHKRSNQLSGGQMQRVAIARALVNDPEILLADEPTGALDSETSIQVMELLKKVANDRLVVMVTHNAELAEQYATRIIRLRDGAVVSDTGVDGAHDANMHSTSSCVPATPVKPERGHHSVKPQPRTKMSFGTSLALSFNNLRTKKARTVLTSFAGSIGIVGIALILALSTGVNQYIEDTQRETMSSYPITIQAQTMDFSVMQQNQDNVISAVSNTDHADAEKIYSDPTAMQIQQAVNSAVTENDLTAFKRYLDDPSNKIRTYLGENGITYEYSTKFRAFTVSQEGVFVNTDSADAPGSQIAHSGTASEVGVSGERLGAGTSGGNENPTGDGVDHGMDGLSLQLSSSSATNNIGVFFGMNRGESAIYFSQMPASASGNGISPSVKNAYELVSGQWPASEGDAVLVLTNNSGVDTKALYQLGLISTDDYNAAAAAVENEQDPPELTLDFTDVIGHNYYVLPEALSYREVTAAGQVSAEQVSGASTTNAPSPTGEALPDVATVYTNQLAHMSEEEIMSDSIKLTISGVIRAKANDNTAMLTTPIAYTSELTKTIISATNASAAVTAQEADPDIDIFTGYTFDEAKNVASKQGIPATSVNTYETNLNTLGKVSVDAPSAINIYVDTFEDKDRVKAAIESYNSSAAKEQKITYTDFVALLTNSITSIINAISYVLIAFVAVSLIVSSIMIGIITHISVLERTKEIGILRALGASKRNISQVFNAETLIIGLAAGLLGVGISALLTIPINALIRTLTDDIGVTAALPAPAALVLVSISMVITVCGGLWPAKRAAKKDPVIALRSE